MSSMSQARMEAARAKLPLRRVIEQAGKAPQNDNWKAFPKCPFCQSGGAGVFTSNVHGIEMFKCFHVPCPSGNEALDEVGFIAQERGLTRSAAWEIYLREAGEWQEERLAPSVMPGSAKRKPEAQAEDGGEHEGLIAECAEALRQEGKASIWLLQRKLGLGYTRTARIMDILEKRGIVGPPRPGEAREVLPPRDVHGPEQGTPVTPGTNGERAVPTPAAEDDALPDAELDALADIAAAMPETADGVESAAVPGASGVPDPHHGSTVPPATSQSLPGGPSFSASHNQGTNGTNGTTGTKVEELASKIIDQMFGESKQSAAPSRDAAPAAGTADAAAEGEPPSPAVQVWRWLYAQFTLLECDVDLLWRKRGLTRETALALGFRSNQKSNKAIMLAAKEQFPPMVLLDAGAFKYPSKKDGDEDTGREIIPNPQFCGMSLVQRRDPVTGKKVRDEEDNAVVEAVWGDPECPQCRAQWGCAAHPGPILIPYFDAKGELLHLRPHKGMMKDRSPRFYVARPCKEWLAGTPAGGSQRSGERAAAVGAVPGITMAKLLLPDIEEWLETRTANAAVVTEGEFKAAAMWQEFDAVPTGVMVRQVVVAYDNEDKRNPALPGYQEEGWKQVDVEVWSRFLAGLLAKQGFDAMVGHLPDSWRDAKGKADWDGRLAARLKELRAVDDTNPRQNVGPTTTATKTWSEVHPLLRAEFMEVLKQAVPVRQLWQSGFFDSKENRIIENRLDRLNYERLLPVGGEDEETIVRRLRRLIPRLKRNNSIPQKSIGYLNLVAQSYEATKGGYYIYKKLTDKEKDKWVEHLATASADGDTDLKRVCELVLFAGPGRVGGLPQRVSDFFLKPHYCLLKTSGERIRLVSLQNIHGVRTNVVRLPASDFAQPAKFREWLLNMISGGTWRAGERELQSLQEDMGRDLARKEIGEVAVRGYHADSKCWFYGDAVYLPDGTHVKADKDGVIWIKTEGGGTQGYTLADKDHENQDFCQGVPRMHPEVALGAEELRAFFLEASLAFYNTQGGYAAYLAMGSVLASFAGPEIYKEWNACTALWVHGQSREGKSCFVRWLLRFLGFNLEKGMPLLDSTKAGLGIALQQYGEGMVWLEEFQPNPPSWLVEKLKNVHDRGSGIKKTYDDEDRRVIRSSVVVTGIATSTNAQLKSRYIHVQVAKRNRKEQTFDWFQKHSSRFYLFGRFALENRKAFAARTVAILREFIEDETILGVDERSRIVHGAAYAAFAAFNELMGNVHGAAALADFRKFAVAHAQDSEEEVNKRMNIAEFWRDLLDALASDAFGVTPTERQRVFKFVPDPRAKSLVSACQVKLGSDYGAPYEWVSGLLYFKPTVVLDMLRKHKRQRGDERPLDQGDLLNHMKVQPYWVPPTAANRVHQIRFGAGDRRKDSCWCIRVDDHELGLLRKSDEEFFASLHPEDGPNAGREDIWLPRDEWIDPRKGDLWELIDSLSVRRAASAEENP